jgi:hypothetical protein
MLSQPHRSDPAGDALSYFFVAVNVMVDVQLGGMKPIWFSSLQSLPDTVLSLNS